MLGRKVPVPAYVRASLEPLFGAAVDDVRVIERSIFAWLHLRAVATTRRRRIYLRGSAADFFNDPKLVLHEYFHVLKQWEPRELSVWRYLVETFRRGYWDNRFEIAAREFADDEHFRFRALLARHRAREESGARHV
jgi:hypothetical protein